MPVSSVIAPVADARRSEPTSRLPFQTRQPWVRYVLAFCLFETAFYFAYRYGMAFSHAAPSPFWFPDSVLLCALLLVRPRWWAPWLLATLPIRLTVAVPRASSLGANRRASVRFPSVGAPPGARPFRRASGGHPATAA